MAGYTVNHPVLGDVTFPEGTTRRQAQAQLLQLGADLLPEESSLEVFLNQGYEGLTSTFRGIGQILGISEESQEDYIDEFNNRVQLEQSPVAGYAGLITGSLLDPVTLPVAFLKPITLGSKVATGAARGAAVGGLGGAIEPTYEEFGDSTLMNVGAGVLLGGGIGAAVGKVAPRALGIDEPTPEVITPEAPAPTPTVEEAPMAGPQPRPPLVGPQQIVDQPARPVIEGPTFTPTQARKIALNQVKANLQERAKYVLKGKQVQKINKTINNLQREVERVNKERAPMSGVREGKKGKFQVRPELKKRNEHINRINLRIEEERAKLKAHEQGKQARAELKAIDEGKATPFGISAIGQRAQQIIGGATPEVTPVSKQKELSEPVGLPTGLEGGLQGADTVSAARVTPKGMIMPEAEAGVDADATMRSVSASRTKAGTKETKQASQGFDREPAPQARETLRQRASRMQFEELNGGPIKQNFDDVIREAEELEARIGDDYDTLLEWAYDTWHAKKRFNAPEQIVFDKLVRASDELIGKSAQKLRALKRTGEHTSDEGIRAFQDLQIAGYVLNIDKANRNQTGRALAIMRVTNERRKGIWKDYSKGKRQSTDVMLMGGC